MAIRESKPCIEGVGNCMSRFFYAVIISIAVLIGFGCSTTPEPDNRKTEIPPTEANTTVASVNEPGPNNVVNTDSFYERDKRKTRVDANPNAKPEPLVYRAAPENSESATTMTSDGSILEVRVFKSHPQIAKVEALWVDPKEKTLKVYLKNGRTVEVTTDRIPNLRDTSSNDILAIAGIRSSPRIGDPSRFVDKK